MTDERWTPTSTPTPILLPRPRSLSTPPEGGRAPADIVAESEDRSLPSDGYRLEASGAGVRLRSGGPEGRRYGLATLAQLAHPVNAPGRTADGTVPACTVVDWPDLPVRAVMLDVSRDKVPTIDTLTDLVERLASWKVNQLQLYMEHTFASAGHEEVWREADPYTADDLRRLDALCAARGISLVPNQNTLGHFERWLRHERYRPLAIAPDGFEWLFGIHRPPTTLDPAKPASFELVADLLGQLAPVLPDRPIHVGLDEPWELAPERRVEWVGWLQRLRRLPVLDGRPLLVWGDIPAAEPALLGALPDDVIVCEWGYERGHPFDERASALRDAGVGFWLAPGTSSWLSITGRVDNMLGNVFEAAEAAVAHGAGGLLVTDWGDMGHLQFPPVSDPGLAAAAAMAWCVESNRHLDRDELATSLDAFCFDDPQGRIGRAVVALGDLSSMVTPRPFNMSPLVQHVLLPQLAVGRGPSAGLTDVDVGAVEDALDTAIGWVGEARPRRSDGDLVADELRAAARLVAVGCRDARLRLAGDGSLSSIPETDRLALANAVDAIVADHRRLWLARNRHGGLEDSLAWLRHLAACYRSGVAARDWFGPHG